MDQESIFAQQLLRLTKKLKRQRYFDILHSSQVFIDNIIRSHTLNIYWFHIWFAFSCQQTPPSPQVSTLVLDRHSTGHQTVEEPLEPHICLMERHLYKHTFSQHLKHQIMYPQHSLIHPVIHQIQIKTLSLLEPQQHNNKIRWTHRDHQILFSMFPQNPLFKPPRPRQLRQQQEVQAPSTALRNIIKEALQPTSAQRMQQVEVTHPPIVRFPHPTKKTR